MSTTPISQEAAGQLGAAKRRAALLAIAAAAVAGVFGFRSWLEARDDRMRMAATLASQGSIIAAAEKREQDRAQELAATLKQIEELKRSVQTPQQVLREIPQFLPPLPQPLETIGARGTPASAPEAGRPAGAAAAATAQATPAPMAKPSALPDTPAKAGEVTSPDVRVPSADLKPLFDFVQDCRACQAKLNAAQQNLQDERATSAALKKERDAAVKAAKGGGVWTRTVRAAKWLAVGFAVGYLSRSARR